MRYIKVAKWWCFWSVLIGAYSCLLTTILMKIFFPIICLPTIAIAKLVFAFLAPFLTFCVGPILNILNIPYPYRVFLELAIFSTVALCLTVIDMYVLFFFIVFNVILKKKDKKMLSPCDFALFLTGMLYFLDDKKIIRSKCYKFSNLDLFIGAVRNFFGYKNSYLPHSKDWKEYIGKENKLDEKTKEMLAEIYEALYDNNAEN